MTDETRSASVPERAPEPIDILDTAHAGPTIIRGGILRFLGYGAGVALALVGAVLLIRHLGPADFGRYSAVVSLTTLVAGVTEAGMTNIGVREYSILAGGTRAARIRQLLGMRLFLVIGGGIVAALAAWAAGFDATMLVGTALTAAGVIVATTQTTYSIPLQAQLKLGWVTLLDLLRQTLFLLGIGFLVVAGAGLLPFFGVAIFAAAPVLVLNAVLVHRNRVLRPEFERSEWGSLLRLTLPFATANAVGVIYAYLAVLILWLVSSEQQVGYFGASFRMFLVLTAIPALLVSSAFPVLARAARDDRARLRYAVSRLWETCLILGVGAGLFAFVGASTAMQVVGGEEFEPAADVLRIQSLALLASFLLATWGFALLSLARYSAVLVANAIALVLSASVTLALAPEFGAEGAAWGTVVGEACLAAGYGVALIRGLGGLRLSTSLLSKVAVAGAAALLPLALPGSDELRLAGALALYAALLILTKAFPREIVEALASGRSGAR